MLEKPGSLGGVVKAKSPKFLPKGYDLAPGFANFGKLRAEAPANSTSAAPGSPRRSAARPAGPSATRASSVARGAPKAGGPGPRADRQGTFSGPGGKTKTLRLEMNRRGRRYFKSHHRLRVEVSVTHR